MTKATATYAERTRYTADAERKAMHSYTTAPDIQKHNLADGSTQALSMSDLRFLKAGPLLKLCTGVCEWCEVDEEA